MKYFFIFLIFIFANVSLAQEEIPIALEKVQINLSDTQSLSRGAKFFATNCMVCHTLIYMRYNKIAEDAGVLYDKMPINVKTWPNGVKPPDLSLEASRRGSNWIYTYLHSFYIDKKRPNGVSNLLVPTTAMPGIPSIFQGQQIRVPIDQDKRIYLWKYQWYDLLALQTPGTMTPEQFDATMTDLVNFLTYASEPYKVQQERLGWWVIGFLLILFIFVYLLKREYWKDVERSRLS